MVAETTYFHTSLACL